MAGLFVRFWGVRGSLPSPGPTTAKYGGNSPCVEVRAGEQLLILDMGSGLRGLGDALSGQATRAAFLLSHYHWDHIQGLPFFAPAYDPGFSFDVYGPTRGGREVGALLAEQMAAPFFPVPMTAMKAAARYLPIGSGDSVQVGGVKVTARELNHPGGVLGYRLDWAGRSLVYATDTEHGGGAEEALTTLSRGADALIFDAMYSPAEYLGLGGEPKTGWGHSTWEAGVRVVRRAGVRKLILFHHEPTRSDLELENLLGAARAHHPDTVLAREGEVLAL